MGRLHLSGCPKIGVHFFDLKSFSAKFALLGQGFRWRIFDSGGSANWRSSSATIPGLSDGGVTPFKDALTMWRSESSGVVNTAYAGTTTATGGLAVADQVNAILFEDPNNEIGGSFNCASGGVLAVGGVTSATGPIHTHNGTSFFNTVEGDVVTQDGAGCFFAGAGEKNGAEVFAHELGHALGLGHSCDPNNGDCNTTAKNQALMRAVAHGDGRGAALSQDDRDGLAFLYNLPAGAIMTNSGGDFNGDGIADILWRHSVSGNDALWLMNGRVAGQGPINRVSTAAQKVQGVGDFNGDGKADIFWRNTAIGTNSIWLMNARTASFGATQTVANLSYNVAGIGDFDGDGKSDVLWRNAETGQNSIWLMNGRTPATGAINATATSWNVGGIGDFDGDGNADILWRNSVNGRNSIWLMNGRTIGFGATSQVANLNIVVSGIGDFNADGKDDILWRNSTNGVNPLWLMNGRTPSFGTTSSVANLDFKVVQVSDFDGDGKADILWRNLTTGDNAMWLMNGRSASFGATSPVADPNWEVVP